MHAPGIITSDQADAIGKMLVGVRRPVVVRIGGNSVDIESDEGRSNPQSNLSFKWYLEAARHFGDRTPTDERAYCKLHFGVPIRREVDADFREKYDRIIKPHTYEDKLEMMVDPFDFPVTRDLKKAEMRRFLDTVCAHYLQQGVRLTIPDGAK